MLFVDADGTDGFLLLFLETLALRSLTSSIFLLCVSGLLLGEF